MNIVTIPGPPVLNIDHQPWAKKLNKLNKLGRPFFNFVQFVQGKLFNLFKGISGQPRPPGLFALFNCSAARTFRCLGVRSSQQSAMPKACVWKNGGGTEKMVIHVFTPASHAHSDSVAPQRTTSFAETRAYAVRRFTSFARALGCPAHTCRA